LGLNYIALSGEVISSPEKKHTQDGQPVTSFNLLISTSEEDDSKSGIVKVSATRKMSDKAISDVSIGDIVFVEGKLYTKTLENRFSQKQKIPYIQSTNIQVIKAKSQNLEASPEIESSFVETNSYQSDDDNIPF